MAVLEARSETAVERGVDSNVDFFSNYIAERAIGESVSISDQFDLGVSELSLEESDAGHPG